MFDYHSYVRVGPTGRWVELPPGSIKSLVESVIEELLSILADETIFVDEKAIIANTTIIQPNLMDW